MTSTANPNLQILKRHPDPLINFQTLLDKIFHRLRYVKAIPKFNWDAGHLIDEFLFRFALPGRLAVEHLVGDDAD